MSNRRKRQAAGGIVGMLLLAACGGGGDLPEGALTGSIAIDGSSTVAPLTEAVAEEFIIETQRGVRVTVAVSGTGGGFRRFCAGEIDISNASRPISPQEQQACATNGVRYVELPVAFDGLAIVVHPSNTFVQCLTVEELRRIWEPSSTIRQWSDLRAEWPAQPIRLYGPGTNSGTFDYFTEEITGEVGASRADYSASEDDNVLVQGVSGDVNSLGYFGFAYYTENRERLTVVAVDAGTGCISPTPETIESGTYAPLSRPLLLYPNLAALERPEVRAFVELYLDIADELAPLVGYVALDSQGYEQSRAKLAEAVAAVQSRAPSAEGP